jgi:transposase InsO family protein
LDASDDAPLPQRWAHLRFSIVGPLLASPRSRGELREALVQLAARTWLHPATRRPVRFSFRTIERWYYRARREQRDPVGALRKRPRKDSGTRRSIPAALREAILAQHRHHPSWSVQLHHDNLAVLVAADASLGPLPSCSTLRRFMKSQALLRTRRRKGPAMTAGQQRAALALEQREVRSYEASHVGALWHFDFHHGSLPVLLPRGEWVKPLCLAVLDDRSRLACHVQWYLQEGARELAHGLSQAFQKRGLPRSVLSDNGSAMTSDEITQGLLRLSVLQDTTLPYSPHQNAKIEVWWAQLEGRGLAMLEGAKHLSLAQLNEATQAFTELEYNRKLHSELGTTPLRRFLDGPDVSRPCPSSDDLRLAFMVEESRSVRRSDCTISLEGRRFEIPSRFRHLSRVSVRFARWDLSVVHLVDAMTSVALDRIYPLDKEKNASGQRRALSPGDSPASEPRSPAGIAPLMKKLLADHAATGLPPAYIPLPDDDDPKETP